MNRKRLVYLSAILVLAALLAFTAFNIQPYDEVVELGPSPEAQRNPYLAAEQFLVTQGRVVKRNESHISTLAAVPDQHVLLLLGPRDQMSKQQVQQLLDWVAGGAHLIFVAEQLWNEQAHASGDPLLDALQLQQYETADENSAPPADAGQPDLTRLYLENEDAPAYLAFDTDFHLYDAESKAHAWANSSGATHMLQLRHGEGLITALTDAWIWRNEFIRNYDHAWLLWYLTQDRDVTLVHDSRHDSLASQLLRHFPEALVALALLLLLGLWHLGQRHGPLQLPEAPGQRQLQEHLRGSADFLYRQAGQAFVLGRLQDDIRRQARRHHPAFDHLPPGEQCRLLARLSQLPEDAIERALRPPSQTRLSAAEFTRQVSHLQSLRNVL